MHRASGHNPADERRREPRVDCALVFPVAAITDEGRLRPAEDLTAIDLSRGGIRLRTAAGYAPGDRAVIEMSGGSGGPGLVGLSIVHVDPEACEVGARFTPLSADVVRAALTPARPIAGCRVARRRSA